MRILVYLEGVAQHIFDGTLDFRTEVISAIVIRTNVHNLEDVRCGDAVDGLGFRLRRCWWWWEVLGLDVLAQLDAQLALLLVAAPPEPGADLEGHEGKDGEKDSHILKDQSVQLAVLRAALGE